MENKETLLKTLFSSRNWSKQSFFSDFIYISTSAADYLAESRVRAVRVDYLSISGYGNNEAESTRNFTGQPFFVDGDLMLYPDFISSRSSE